MIFNTIRRAIPGNVLILLAIVAFLALFHSTGRETRAFWYPKQLSEVPFSTPRNVTKNNLPLQKTGPQRGMSVQKPPPPCPACTCPTATASFSNPAPKSKETEAANIDEKYTAEQETIARLRDEGIVIVFKIGSQEISQLAFHLGTTLRYLSEKDILFFSDVQGTLGPFILNDALKNVNHTLIQNEPDFEIYRQIQEFKQTGREIAELKEEKKIGDERKGWRLDKYKFLHMVEDAYAMRPDAKWYVFIETDSYVIWSNLVSWLQTLDSSKPLYLGSTVYMGTTPFAHGGSGYVLSNAALQKLLGPEQPQGLASSWDLKMKDECCGDVALGMALTEKGVNLTDAVPFSNGYKPTTIPYNPRGGEHWCQPVVFMHHLVMGEVSNLWRFERKREVIGGPQEPIRFKDLYAQFVKPHLRWEKENWDNLSEAKVLKAPEVMVEDMKRKIEEEKEREAELKKEEDSGKNIEENKEDGLSNEEGEEEGAKNNDSGEDEQRKKEEEKVKMEAAAKQSEPVDEFKLSAEELNIKKEEERRKDQENEERRKIDEQLKLEGNTMQIEEAGELPKKPESSPGTPAVLEIANQNNEGAKTSTEATPQEANVTAAPKPVLVKREDGEKKNEEDKKHEGEKKEEVQNGDEELTIASLNLSNIELAAHESFPNCRSACEASSECLQFSHLTSKSENICKLSPSIRLGQHMKPGEKENRQGDGMEVEGFKSGWMMERIREVVESEEAMCEGGVKWDI